MKPYDTIEVKCPACDVMLSLPVTLESTPRADRPEVEVIVHVDSAPAREHIAGHAREGQL